MTNATILIVEDDGILATYLQTLLERFGYQVLGPVSAGEEALAMVNTIRADLVLMDIELSGHMDGIAAATEIARTHDLPIVFLTGFSQEPLLQQAKTVAPYGYVIKPVAERELAAMLEMALHRHAQDRQLRKSQADLQRSETKYRMLFESAPLGIFRSVPDGRILDINPEMARIFGYPSLAMAHENLTNMSAGLYVNPERREQLLALLQESGEVSNFEFLARKADGSTIWISMNATMGKADVPGGVVIDGFIKDITRQKQSEQALQESEQMMRSIFRVAPSGIGVVINRNLAEVNDQFCTMTGYSRDEVIGRNARMLYLSDEDYGYVGTEKYRQIAEKGTGSVETRWLRKDGTVIHIILSSTPLDPHDLSKGVTFTALDISDRIRAEEERSRLREQLAHAQKMEEIGRLIGGVAHDFNNHLTAIIGCSQMVLSRMPTDTDLGHFIEMIHTSGERAAALTRSLLTFSRKQPLEMRPLDVHIVLNNIQKLLMRLIGEDIELQMKLAEYPLFVNADIGQLEQVIMNLATNARDAMPDGGQLHIITERLVLDQEFMGIYGWGEPGAYVALSVVDTGAGIPEEVRERIFEPYFTSKEPGRGTGLGLSIVHGIVQQHGGHIVLQSAMGKGTVFTVYLPLLVRQDESRVVGLVETAPGGAETILVCEDDQFVRRMVRLVLEGAGYQVVEACDGEDALELFYLNRQRIQMVILDVIMPKKNGVLVYRELKEIEPSLPAIFTSGYTPESISKSGLYDLQVPFLQKPVTPTVLLKQVREVLDQLRP